MPTLLGWKAVMLFWRTRMKITTSMIQSLLILFMRIHGRQKNWISKWVCCWVFPLVFLWECLYLLFIRTGYFQCMQNSMPAVVWFWFLFQRFTNVPRPLTVMVLGKKSAVMRSLSPPKGKKEQHTHTHTNRHMFTQLNHFAIHLKLTQHDESTIFCWWCSVAKSHLTLGDPVDCSTPGSSVHHCLPSSVTLRPTESVMLSHHLILCHPLLLLPSIFPSIRVFSNESALPIRWPKYWSFSISNSPSNEYRIDWFDLLAVQGTPKSLLQHHNSKPLVLRLTAFFMVQLSPSYMTTGKIIALTIWTFAAKWCLCFLICCLGLSQLSFQGASIF